MKKIIILFSTLILAQTAFAQDISTSVGAKHYVRSEQNALGIQIDYRSADGLFVPVTIDLGQDLQSFGAGIGYKTGKELSDIFAYSIAGAFQYLSFSEDLDSIMKHDKKRLVALIQQEVSLQLSNRLTLGVNYNLDIMTAIRPARVERKTSAEGLRNLGYYENSDGTFSESKNSYYYQTPDFATEQEKQENIQSAINSSGTNFGLSLKIRLGK